MRMTRKQKRLYARICLILFALTLFAPLIAEVIT